MYPASQFKDKQETETRRLQKEADKLKEKFETNGFVDCP